MGTVKIKVSDPFPRVLGIDGCRAGWLGVTWDGQYAHSKLYESFSDIIAEQAEVIAVDMPIGLPDLHGREAETAARKVLGARKSSVFSTPSCATFQAKNWEDACEINLKHSNPPRKLSKQSFGLFPKIKEIDALISPILQLKVHEVHPEVAFFEMNGRASLHFNKKTKDGEAERQSLLQRHGFPNFDLSVPLYPRKRVARDDIIDACACAWSARRIQLGQERNYPAKDVLNSRGLYMRIKA
jgi:predicted RNase H-like nuclease